MATTMRAVRTTLEQIQPLRRLFLQEANHQVRYDAVHARGWSESYVLTCDETVAGYGAIMGGARTDRNTVFESDAGHQPRSSSALEVKPEAAHTGVRHLRESANVRAVTIRVFPCFFSESRPDLSPVTRKSALPASDMARNRLSVAWREGLSAR